MCESNAYIIEHRTNDSGEEVSNLFMEAVDRVIPENGGLRVTSIFGDQKFVKGYIYSLALVNHKIFIKEL